MTPDLARQMLEADRSSPRPLMTDAQRERLGRIAFGELGGEQSAPVDVAASEPMRDEAATPAAVKVHPSLAAAILRRDAEAAKGERRIYATAYYLLCLGKAADETGDGRIELDKLRVFCVEHGMSRKKFERYLNDAEAADFVELIDRRDGSQVIELRSVERVALLLGCTSVGWPVTIPLGERHTGSVGKWRAALLAAWHGARRRINPISQKALEQVTGIKPRRQHEYHKRAGVNVKRNYAESRIEAKHLAGVRLSYPHAFARAGVIVLPMPNDYHAPFERAAHRGMARNVDRALSAGVLLSPEAASSNGDALRDPAQSNLSRSGASGRGQGQRRIYHSDQKRAVTAYRHSESGLVFYRAFITGRGKSQQRIERHTRDGSLLWGVMGLEW